MDSMGKKGPGSWLGFIQHYGFDGVGLRGILLKKERSSSTWDKRSLYFGTFVYYSVFSCILSSMCERGDRYPKITNLTLYRFF